MQDIEIDINGSRHFVESTPKVVLLSKEIQLHCLLPDWIGMCKSVQRYKNVFHMRVELALYEHHQLAASVVTRMLPIRHR